MIYIIKKELINLARVIAMVLILVSIVACDTNEVQNITTLEDIVNAGSDEFNVNGAPDSALWSFDIGDGSDQGIPGWGNDELQYYTDRPENVTVQNGFLIITAQEEDFEGSQYTSARLLTKGKFQQRYGRFEARIKLPSGRGMWPAFWLLGDDNNGAIGWPQRGEIDIMEYNGSEPTIVHGSVHGPGYCGNSDLCDEDPITKELDLVNLRLDTEFHVYGIEWGPDYINYYIDDKLYNQITPETVNEETDGEGQWVFNDRSFYILINLAVGGGFVDDPDETTVFPQRMLVDYVRVYN